MTDKHDFTEALHFINSTADAMSCLSEPLTNLNITTFSYIKLFEHKLLRLSNNLRWTNYYVTHQLYELDYKDSCQEHILKLKENNTLRILCKNGTTLSKAMHHHGVWHGMSIYKKFDTHVEVFNFATEKENDQIVNFFINDTELFERFIFYFKNKAENIINTQDNRKFLHREKPILFKEKDPVKKSHQDFFTLTTIKTFELEQKNINITQRESECLHLLSCGNSPKLIGLLLGISNRTVETHINNLKYKLSCNNTTELIKKYQDELLPYFKAELKHKGLLFNS